MWITLSPIRVRLQTRMQGPSCHMETYHDSTSDTSIEQANEGEKRNTPRGVCESPLTVCLLAKTTAPLCRSGSGSFLRNKLVFRAFSLSHQSPSLQSRVLNKGGMNCDNLVLLDDDQTQGLECGAGTLSAHSGMDGQVAQVNTALLFNLNKYHVDPWDLNHCLLTYSLTTLFKNV